MLSVGRARNCRSNSDKRRLIPARAAVAFATAASVATAATTAAAAVATTTTTISAATTTSATTTAAVSSAATTTATGAGRAFAGFIYHEGPAAALEAVEGVDRRFHIAVVRHLHETE